MEASASPALHAICEEHRALDRRAGELLQIVAAAVPDPAAVAALRWGLAQALIDHCTREERGLYAQLLASGDASAVQDVLAFRHRYGQLARRVADYIDGWPVARIGRDWAAFRTDTGALVAELRSRIAAEEAGLLPHVVRLASARIAA
jgi:hypothetical protein